MPRKLKLAYKKHGSVKPKPQDVSEEGYLSGVAHSSTQTDQASETMSTQTDSVDTCDVPCNISSQTDKKDTCDVAIQTAKEQPSDQPNLLTPLPFSATVKVDIDLFYSLGIVNINQLQRRLSCMKCIYGNWFLVPARLEADKLQIVRLSQQQLQCSFVVEVFEDLKWSLQLPSQQLSPSTSLVLKHLPEAVTSVFVLRSVLMFLDQCTICQGNPDPKFAPIVAHSKGIFKDRSGLKVNAYFDQKTLTIRHVSCYWLLSDCTKDRCPVCVQYRESFLRSKLRSVLDDTKQDGSEASSHVNHRYLAGTEHSHTE